MLRLLSVANIPPQTHEVLKRNLAKWVGIVSSDEWQKKCLQASADGAYTTTLSILGTLRAAAEQNREKRESSKRASEGKNQSRKFRRGAQLLDGTRSKHAPRDGNIADSTTGYKTTRLENA